MFGEHAKKCEPKVTYTVVTDIKKEVISLEDAKAFMTIDFPDFNTLILLFIKGAREEAERYTGLSIGVRTIQLAGEWTDKKAYMPFEPIQSTSDTGEQVVGYTDENLPGDLKIALLNMVHTAFDNRTTGLSYGTSLKLLDKSRRRVGL